MPLGSVGISLFGYLMATSIPADLPIFSTFADFVTYSALWPLFAYLLLIGVFGGVFIVPLYAMLQQRAKVTERAQVIAALNIYNSLFMVGSARWHCVPQCIGDEYSAVICTTGCA